MGDKFTSRDLHVPGVDHTHTSVALSDLRRQHEVLEVIDKRGPLYVYQLLSLETLRPFGIKKDIPAGYHRGPNRIKRHVLTKDDFITVTGRISSGQPEMQDLRPHGQQYPRQLPAADFSGIEERIAQHYHAQMAEGNRLLDEMSRSQTLAECSIDELFAELRRRLSGGN